MMKNGDAGIFPVYYSLKTMNLEEQRDRSPACVNDENGVFLRDVQFIHERWLR